MNKGTLAQLIFDESPVETLAGCARLADRIWEQWPKQSVEAPVEVTAVELALERIANALEALVRELCTDKEYHDHP